MDEVSEVWHRSGTVVIADGVVHSSCQLTGGHCYHDVDSMRAGFHWWLLESELTVCK